MGNDAAWPSFRNLKSIYNKNQGVPEMGPPVSQNIINQIANCMDNIGPRHTEITTPPIKTTTPPTQVIDKAGDSELKKLLDAGYRPIHKNGQNWSEVECQNNTKMILE